jgi:chromate reductase, NAD(P)H dehydrogenase (quinone)
MTTTPLRILGLAGSLRRDSYNRALLRAAVDLSPAGVEITTFDQLGALPFYDGDVEALGEPPAVRRLRSAIATADAILLVTPEYNDGTSAVLKNAIDWASRPPSRSLAGKPAAVIGASVTPSGARGGIESVQRSLRRAGADVIDAQVAVPGAANVFDADLKLADQLVGSELVGLLSTLTMHVRQAAHKVAA